MTFIQSNQSERSAYLISKTFIQSNLKGKTGRSIDIQSNVVKISPRSFAGKYGKI